MLDFYIKSSLILSGILIVIFLILIYEYKKILSNKIISRPYILLTLRFSSLVMITYLFINPLLVYKNKLIEKPKIGIFIDNSKSMSIFQSLSDNNYLDSIDSLLKYLQNKKYVIEKFAFADSLKKINSLSDINFNKSLTNFSSLNNLKNKYDLDYNIIVTDGIRTVGKNIEETNFKNPTFAISVGDSVKINDVKIEKIDFKRLYDNEEMVEILCVIKSKLDKEVYTNLTIKNENGDVIFNNFIKINKGENLLNQKIVIKSSLLSIENIISVMKVEDEYNIENNSKKIIFNFIEKPMDILLISGTISTNTYLIKKNIRSEKRNTLNHVYAFNKNSLDSKLKKIDFSKYDLIILDAYLGKKIFASNNFIIFFEGPNMLVDQNELISDIFNIERKTKKNLLEANLVSSRKEYSLNNFSLLPPFKRNFTYFSKKKENILFKYNDNSDAVVINNNAVGVFIPEIGNVYKKVSANENKQIIDDFFKTMIAYTSNSNKSIISFQNTNKYLNLGESLEIGIKYSHLVEPRYINRNLNIVAYKDSIEKQLNLQYDQLKNQYYVNFSPKEDGKWSIKGSFFFNDEILNIDPVELYVENNDLEALFINDKSTYFRNTILNTGGKYININELLKTLNIFNFKDYDVDEIVNFESVDIFEYLSILVIILCVEWYYRKQKGLL